MRSIRFPSRSISLALLLPAVMAVLGLAPEQAARVPLHQTVDLNVGESASVALGDGSKVAVRVIRVSESRDRFRSAVREARVVIEVNGAQGELVCANYRLPVTLGGVQIDCPATSALATNSRSDAWGLDKSARLRIWPAKSAWIDPGAFKYPARQKWFASGTQMANEPTFVDGGEVPGTKTIYYHNGLDIGGAEGMVDVIAATDGLVVSSGTDRLPGHDNTPVAPRYDVVYLLDARGWYYRYSHLKTIAPAIRPGATVKMGDAIGVLGKEGGSGGWSHLHFEIGSRQPSGKWGTEEGYAFLWQSYVAEFQPDVIAVARPHHLAAVGESVVLDGSRSWARSGGTLRYDWTMTDGSAVTGPRIERRYDRPGMYSEILKVTDAGGRTAWDFAAVQVIDPAEPQALPPSIQAAYAPSLSIRAGDPVTFKVRTFRTQEGQETWDFGDGTPPVNVKSDGNANIHNPDGFAVIEHRFAKPGDYIVSVKRANARGFTATARLWVRVGSR
jgi:murein DD-endopeptidase MepM/ murein hydrolase activator NlpD